MVSYPIQNPSGPTRGVYIGVIHDIAGTVAANNFLSVFNPATSGVIMQAQFVQLSSYAAGVTTASASLIPTRTTAASGGNLTAAANVPRFATAMPNPKCELRTGNPTVTTDGFALGAWAPVISTGTGESAASANPPPGASFVCLPGEGLVFSVSVGDADQVWNIDYVWSENNIEDF